MRKGYQHRIFFSLHPLLLVTECMLIRRLPFRFILVASIKGKSQISRIGLGLRVRVIFVRPRFMMVKNNSNSSLLSRKKKSRPATVVMETGVGKAPLRRSPSNSERETEEGGGEEGERDEGD